MVEKSLYRSVGSRYTLSRLEEHLSRNIRSIIFLSSLPRSLNKDSGPQIPANIPPPTVELRTRVHFFQLPSPYFFGLPGDFGFDAADDVDDDEGGNAILAAGAAGS
jgi:hypothetical protein